MYKVIKEALYYHAENKKLLLQDLTASADLQRNWSADVDQKKEAVQFLQRHEHIFNPRITIIFDQMANDPSEGTLVVNDETTADLASQLSTFCLHMGQKESELGKLLKEIDGLKVILRSYKENPEFGNFIESFQELCDLEFDLFITQLRKSEITDSISLLESNNSIEILII